MNMNELRGKYMSISWMRYAHYCRQRYFYREGPQLYLLYILVRSEVSSAKFSDFAPVPALYYYLSLEVKNLDGDSICLIKQ